MKIIFITENIEIERYINNTKAISSFRMCSIFFYGWKRHTILNSTQKGIKYSLEPRSAILLTSVLFLQVRLVHVHLNTIPCGSNGKEFATVQETQVQSLGQEAPLEKGMTTHYYSCLENSMDREVWKGPWGHKELDMTNSFTFL